MAVPLVIIRPEPGCSASLAKAPRALMTPIVGVVLLAFVAARELPLVQLS